MRKPDARLTSQLSALSPRPEGDLLSLLRCLHDSFSSPAFQSFTGLHLQVHRDKCFLRSSDNFPLAKFGSFLHFKTTGFCCVFGCSASSPPRLCSIHVPSSVHCEHSCVCGTYHHPIQMSTSHESTPGPGHPLCFLGCSVTCSASLQPGCLRPTQPSDTAP